MPIFDMFGYHSWNISYCIGNNKFLQFAATITKKNQFFCQQFHTIYNYSDNSNGRNEFDIQIQYY